MIWESHFWEDDLLKKAARLRRVKTQRRWPESRLAKLEQTLMLGFYGIRKLHEAVKLSTSTMQQRVPLITYPWSGKNVTKLNWHNLDKLYDFEAASTEEHDLLFLCNQFVHSYVFCPAFDNHGRLDGVLFASDRQRHKALLLAAIDQVAGLFDQVGNDYPNTRHSLLNAKTGEYDVVAAMMPDGR
jgi:hypothetical protein